MTLQPRASSVGWIAARVLAVCQVLVVAFAVWGTGLASVDPQTGRCPAGLTFDLNPTARVLVYLSEDPRRQVGDGRGCLVLFEEPLRYDQKPLRWVMHMHMQITAHPRDPNRSTRGPREFTGGGSHIGWGELIAKDGMGCALHVNNIGTEHVTVEDPGRCLGEQGHTPGSFSREIGFGLERVLTHDSGTDAKDLRRYCVKP